MGWRLRKLAGGQAGTPVQNIHYRVFRTQLHPFQYVKIKEEFDLKNSLVCTFLSLSNNLFRSAPFTSKSCRRMPKFAPR